MKAADRKDASESPPSAALPGSDRQSDAAATPEKSAKSRPVAASVGRLLIEALKYLGLLGLDAIYFTRFLLLRRAGSPVGKLRDERSKRWSEWRKIPGARRIQIRAASALLVLAFLIAIHSYFSGSGVVPWAMHSSGPLATLVKQARAEAGKWHPDAVLVQLELSDFGFATGPNGIPDMTKSGPPGLMTLNFWSPSSHDAMRVVAESNLTPDQLKFLKSQGTSPIRAERLPTPYSPYTLPVPDSDIDPAEAIAQAHKDVVSECAGSSIQTGSCSLVSGAELHSFWRGPDQSGSPVWTIRFGQNPKTLQTVTREVSATSGELVTLTDAQRGSINPQTAERSQSFLLPNVLNDFDSVWTAVNQAMAKKDPLYHPYAATLISYLRDNRGQRSSIYLSEAEFQFARITPSLYWDDRTLHIKWTGSAAVLDISPSAIRAAPLERFPRTMESPELPSEDATLRKILDAFPEGYAEQYTTWERGCQNMMTISPSIKEWECGVLVPTVHRTDEVFMWMTRQGNPYWESAAAPFQSENALVSNHTPEDDWVWWTRVKRPNQWQYVVVNAATGAPITAADVCTAPPQLGYTSPMPLIACN